jgi:cyclopropane fatty-acyl-phospholipid synthase-like methyltransferase
LAVNEISIADVPLYTNLDRIARGLSAHGIGVTDPIPPEQLFDLDQWHYHGTDAIRAAADQLGLGPASHVLDVGSGVGGPARYLAYTIGCRVTALELQPEVNAVAIDLTRRSGLDQRVTHIVGDALTFPFAEGQFDAVVSWLAILHIPYRPRLLERFSRVLRSGGRCYIEDFWMRAPFAPDDLRDLREIVFGVSVTGIEDYVKEMRTAGFADVQATDCTSDWASFTAERHRRWRQNHESHARVQGEDAYAAQERFYSVMARLYASGSLGGVRLLARAP